MEAYYYSKMNKVSQSVYHAMKTGILAIAPSFPVPRLEGSELQDIFFQLRLDCPDIFYAVGFRYRYYKDAGNVEILPEYLFDKKKIIDHRKAMQARISKLIRPVSDKSEWDKEVYIHDFICSSVHYDKLKKPYSHEIIGPLGQGVGVCEGMAKTVKILCDALGIWCIIVISEANPDKGIKYRHAWNIVRIGGTCYHLDATFDNNLSSESMVRYDYFNLSDKQLFRDHEPAIHELPRCGSSEHFYYKEKKVSFTKMEDVNSRARQAIRKGKPLVFHWRGGHLTRAVCRDLIDVLAKAGEPKGMYPRVILNPPQAIVSVIYTGNPNEEQYLLEEATEEGKTTVSLTTDEKANILTI